MQEFLDFVLHNCILIFDVEQVTLKLQVIIGDLKPGLWPDPDLVQSTCSIIRKLQHTLNPKP